MKLGDKLRAKQIQCTGNIDYNILIKIKYGFSGFDHGKCRIGIMSGKKLHSDGRY